MLADKEPTLDEPCFICNKNTSDADCAIILRGTPEPIDASPSYVTVATACLRHADALADILDKPYVNDGLKQFGIHSPLEELETRCFVCGDAFEDDGGVIGLFDVRLHYRCVDEFIHVLRNTGDHAHELLGTTL